jgi:hypothetical protein
MRGLHEDVLQPHVAVLSTKLLTASLLINGMITHEDVLQTHAPIMKVTHYETLNLLYQKCADSQI